MENGRWKELKDINTTQCTQPTIRRLTANLRTAEAFLRRHYPNLLFRHQTTKRSTDSPPHTQMQDVQQIICIKRRQTDRQWSMGIATGN
jgi:hypothetical protein